MKEKVEKEKKEKREREEEEEKLRMRRESAVLEKGFTFAESKQEMMDRTP